ncbi:MAG: hypothetical protein ACO3VG_05045 [Nitriliruptoraceae bacterium]
MRAVEPLGRAVGRQGVGGFERLQDQRRRVGVGLRGPRVAAEVLAAEHPLLRDDRPDRRVEPVGQLGEGVRLRDDLGQRTQPVAGHAGLGHRGRERRRPLERDAVGGVPGRPPELAAGPLGRGEAGVAEHQHGVPVAAGAATVHLADQAVEVAEVEQVAEVRVRGHPTSIRSTANTRVSPGPMTLPAPRSP